MKITIDNKTFEPSDLAHVPPIPQGSKTFYGICVYPSNIPDKKTIFNRFYSIKEDAETECVMLCRADRMLFPPKDDYYGQWLYKVAEFEA